MNDLDKIKAENAQRRVDWGRASDLPMPAIWNTIDALVAEIEWLRAGVEQYADEKNWEECHSTPYEKRDWVRWDDEKGDVIRENGFDLARSLLSSENPVHLGGK